MGLDERIITELVSPQEVKIFRVPTKTLGRVIIHWGCMSLHNNARGPYKGGIRLTENVTLWETVELSRLMTLKTAVNDIELGGGKTGIRVDMPKMYRIFNRRPRDPDFERIIRIDVMEYFAYHFREIFASHEYVPAPDVNTGGEEMAVIFNQTMDPASVTGKPSGVHGWLPGRREATGRGCFEVCRLASEHQLDKDLSECRVAIQGFGNVGGWAARFLYENGADIIAVTDSRGGAYDKDGLDIPGLKEYKKEQGMVSGFSGEIGNEDLFKLDTDITIPAALGGAINKGNAGDINSDIVVEGANMPVTCEGMRILERKGVRVVPDIIANAGGVIASMEEYSGSLSAVKTPKSKVFDVIGDRIESSYLDALDFAESEDIELADAAVQIATERVYEVMKKRSLI